MKNAIILRLIKELYVSTLMEYLREKAASTETKIDDRAVSILETLLGIEE